MPTRRFKSKEQQRIEAKLGVASSWGFTVKRDRASVWPPTERNDRPRDTGGFRCPDGRTMAAKYSPESAIGRVKSYAGKANFYGKPKADPLENLPLSEHPDNLETNKGVAVKNAIARVLSIFPENRTGCPVVKDTGKRGVGVVKTSPEVLSSAVSGKTQPTVSQAVSQRSEEHKAQVLVSEGSEKSGNCRDNPLSQVGSGGKAASCEPDTAASLAR